MRFPGEWKKVKWLTGSISKNKCISCSYVCKNLCLPQCKVHTKQGVSKTKIQILYRTDANYFLKPYKETLQAHN